MKRLVRILGLWVADSLLTSLQAQPFPKAASEQIKAEFTDVHRKLLDMAKDFPADHYSYRLTARWLCMLPLFGAESR